MPTFRGYARLLQLGGIEREYTPVPQTLSIYTLQEEIDSINHALDAKTKLYQNVFYMGGGTSYSSVMNNAHMIPVNVSMGINANVTCADGDNIILVIAGTFRDNFVRADMNGMEIKFTETTQTVGGVQYKVLTSENTYQAGTYNIDINS